MTLSERLAVLDGRSNSNESWMEGSIAGDEYVAIAREAVAALNEVEGAFAMQTDAIQRTAAAWREMTGKELVSPDTTRLVYWLLWDREDAYELLDRAARMFRAMRYRIQLADGKPLDQWLADYATMTESTTDPDKRSGSGQEESMKRWKITVNTPSGWVMVESPEGEYILANEAIVACRERDEEIARLRNELEWVRERAISPTSRIEIFRKVDAALAEREDT